MENNKKLICKLKECLEIARARGYCHKHVQRIYRTGSLILKKKDRCKNCGKLRSPNSKMILCEMCNRKYKNEKQKHYRAMFPKRYEKYNEKYNWSKKLKNEKKIKKVLLNATN